LKKKRFPFSQTKVKILLVRFILFFNYIRMKKGIAIGILAIASMVLIGCQQQPAPTTTTTPAGGEGSTATTTATVKVEEAAKSVNTTGSLEIKPATEATEVTTPSEVNTTGSLEITPAPATTPTEPVPPVVPVPQP
jgi:hypothetical protein